ncbi:hypothetical protein GALL_316580 [mine drainage metagenome]|uniref:Uncharacterized protein n=1 Tax=mine drainage metagenome TaxID=410659 RepID=A0A1J5QT33_9ZZZZ
MRHTRWAARRAVAVGLVLRRVDSHWLTSTRSTGARCGWRWRTRARRMPVRVTANPQPAFHRRSSPDRLWGPSIGQAVRASAAPSPGRSPVPGSKAGHDPIRSANTDPAISRCPANGSASPNLRCPPSRPCLQQQSQPTQPACRRDAPYRQSPSNAVPAPGRATSLTGRVCRRRSTASRTASPAARAPIRNATS